MVIALPRPARLCCGLSILLIASLSGCMSTQTPRQPPAEPGLATFVIVRHAEKRGDDPDDPALTAAGHARAQRLADSLRDAPVGAVYSTHYRRAQQTAAPVAAMQGVQVTTYDAKISPVDLAAQLRRAHPAGAVLVVGHSNTAPDIAAALCDCEVASMDETEYDLRITVRVAADGGIALTTTRDP